MASPAANTTDLTDDQREIQALAREFARAQIRPIAAEVDESDVVSPLGVVAKAAEVGLTSFMLPEEVGGGGIDDVLTGCVVQEELNWGCAGIGTSILANGLGAKATADDQRIEFAPQDGGDDGPRHDPRSGDSNDDVWVVGACDLEGQSPRQLAEQRPLHLENSLRMLDSRAAR